MGKPQVPPGTVRLDKPTLIPAERALRFLWGDAEAGLVSDWIYGSSAKIHMMAFALSPGRGFRNSADFRTCYDAAETYYCLKGEFTFHCPDTGEVHVLRRGDALYIPPRTWHYGFNFGAEECRILEAITPPLPERIEEFSARQPPLERERGILDGVLGRFVATRTRLETRAVPIRPADYLYEMIGTTNPMRVGLLVSTELLTTGIVDLYPGQSGDALRHPGDKVAYVLEGTVNVQIWDTGEWWEMRVGDSCFLPEGVSHGFFNTFGEAAKLIFSVAPRYR